MTVGQRKWHIFGPFLVSLATASCVVVFLQRHLFWGIDRTNCYDIRTFLSAAI